MTIQDWIDQGMRESGIKSQKDLAEKAGVSQPTISQGKKRGYFRDSTLRKLENVLGSYKQEKHATDKIDYNPLDEVHVPLEEALKNFKGKDCPTSTQYCSGCYKSLKQLKKDKQLRLPETAAACRLEHGWKLDGGILSYTGDSK